MNIIKKYIPLECPNRSGVIISPSYITIHETDNTNIGANAKAHSEYLDNKGVNVSWHFTVDDKEIYQHLPLYERGIHSGNIGNDNSIAIEICVNSDGNYEKALQNTIWLVKELNKSKKYKLTNHNIWTGKLCPRKLINSNRWEWFKKQCEDKESVSKEELINKVEELLILIKEI